VSVLAHDHDDIARSLAAKGVERFATVVWEANEAGAVFVHGSALWLECEIADELPAGDHDIALLRVVSVQPHSDVTPMVFHGSKFRQLAS
jgi:flavin reductase (DIM6/NTAB) family NADH-FMN oxidoreductase RutF